MCGRREESKFSVDRLRLKLSMYLIAKGEWVEWTAGDFTTAVVSTKQKDHLSVTISP